FRAVALLHVPCPDAACGTELRNLLEEIVVDVPEEGEPRCEVVDVESARNSMLYVAETVGEGKGELLRGSRTRFANVIAGNRHGVPQRRVCGTPLETIHDE